jgi:FlaG/FlaF family flagellin (archaellin)
MMQKKEQAVSPVVGVMLMLVVTIIIAAVVSAFAGSTVSGVQKTPQATILATYSQSQGMTITNDGGDAVPIASTKILVSPGKSFGANYTQYSWVVNQSYINWPNSRAFRPGDTATITSANLSYVQQRQDLTTGDSTDPILGFDNNSTSVGLSFDLQFVDSGGNTIGKTTVTIAS